MLCVMIFLLWNKFTDWRYTNSLLVQLYSHLITQQCATAETKIEKHVPPPKKEKKSMCPLIKESPISYFNQQVFSPPVYSSINDIPNNK